MKIIYTNAEGGTSIVTPVEGSGLTLQEVIDRSVPPGTEYTVVNDDAVPADRTYRNAWAINPSTKAIEHDIVKAREIHKDHMRRSRTPLMTALDTAYLKADEKGAAGNAEKATIVGQKQVLRDVTADPGIAAAQTVAELKQVWPVALGPNRLV